MNCKCLDFNEKMLIENYAKLGAVNPRVFADFLGINMQTGDEAITLAYTIHGDNRPYNTRKGQQCNIVANFCPFCGKSVKKEES